MAKLSNIESELNRFNFFKFKSIGEFVINLFQIALILGSIAAFLYLIWGGIEYIMSGGNQERTKSAKEKVSSAIAGLAILAAAWVIWRIVIFFLGISPSLTGPFKIKLPQP